VSGSLERVSLTLKATKVLIVSKDRFVLSGIITDVRPATGDATAVDLLVKAELPDIAGVEVGQITTISLADLSGTQPIRLRVLGPVLRVAKLPQPTH
jgi:hypothetical protein